MLQIVVANTAEAFAPLLDRADPGSDRVLHELDLAGRALFWGGSEVIIVASEPIDRTLTEHIRSLLRHTRLDVWHPAKSSLRLCSDVLADDELLLRLLSATKAGGSYRVRPYAITPEFCTLSSRLGWGRWDEALGAATEFDSKAGFRRLFEGSELPLPEGFICDTALETAAAIHEVASSGRRLVVKVHNGESGWGLRFLESQGGALATIDACKVVVQRLFSSDPIWMIGPYIVETVVDVDPLSPGSSPSGEARVEGGSVHFDYLCDQIVTRDGEFAGVSIGVEAEASPHADWLRRNTLLVGEKLGARSYDGTFDVDFVIDRGGKAFAVECNARLTGGTHVFGAAQASFGIFWRERSFLSKDEIRYEGDRMSAAEILDRINPLLLRTGGESGVIPSFISQRRPVLGAIAVGSSRDHAMSLMIATEQLLRRP